LPAGGLAGLAPLLVLAPHPDDESLACGALLARLAAAGAGARVVAVSDGAASHPGSRSHPPARLAGLRAAELRAALAELGLPASAVRRLDLPDGRVPRAGTAGFADALEHLRAACGGFAPVAIAASWRHDPHGDHQATFELAAALRERLGPPRPRLLEYVVWGWDLPPGAPLAHGGPPRGFRLEPDPAELGRKRRAVEAHGSQLGRVVTDDPDGCALPPSMVERCVGEPELFLEMDA
jgi:LmbE family N-acetylglucosaminyl deacetylase